MKLLCRYFGHDFKESHVVRHLKVNLRTCRRCGEPFIAEVPGLERLKRALAKVRLKR